MNPDQIEGNWKQLKGRFREAVGQTTNHHLDVVIWQENQISYSVRYKRNTDSNVRQVGEGAG